MPIILFAIVFVLTIFLQRWLHRHIQGLALILTGDAGCAIRFLFYLLMPGVLLHEMSHYVMARLLLVRTGAFRIGIGNTNRRQVSLGSVNIERTDPIRESLVGVAPFIVGVGAIWLVAGVGFDLWPSTGLSIAEFFRRVQLYAYDWTTWLDLYLIFSVSAAMIPSESDREPWGPVITFFGLGTAILFLLGWTPRVPNDAMTMARSLLDALTFALGVAVVVNGITAIALWVLEQTVLQISGRQVEYHVKSSKPARKKKSRG
ncbi:MAG: hypothetical protein HZB51_18620 [Chloroflexi bacterium]|nr:hypothetical protein [Chloroflexota bacterium]